MANWLDLSSTSNMLKSAYVKGFVDISGGDFIARTGNLYIQGTSSLVGAVTICGELRAVYPAGSIPSNAIVGGTGISSSADVALTQRLQVSGDVSLNSKLYVAGAAVFAGVPTAPTATAGTNTTQLATTAFVTSAVALKPSFSQVDASLALKPSFAQVDASLNLKPSFAQVDASLNLKPSFSQVDASLNLKPSFSQVDASLNLKPSFAQVDASLNLKSNLTYVDSSLNLKSAVTYVDASLNLKSAVTYVDSSLNLKSNLTYVDASLNVKPSFSQVDASLNLKANLVSPTFTGPFVVASGDVSMNNNLNLGGNLVVNGNLTVFRQENASIINTTVSNYEIVITKDISLNGNLVIANNASLNSKLFVTNDVSLNSKLAVSNDASFNGRVDICGNLYAQYPEASIPVSAVNSLSSVFSQIDASLNLKSDITYVDASLNLKASTSNVDASLNLKSDITYVDASLNLKASTSNVDASLNLKSDITYVDASLNLKASTSNVDASLNLKSDITYVDASLNLKASTSNVDASLNLKSDITYVDASLNLKASTSNVDASLNLKSDITYVDASLNLKADLASPTLTGTPSAPTAAASTNSTQIATTEFVKTAVANLVASAPATLDTLNELAMALGSDASFSTTVSNSIGLKAPIDNPTFTGTVGGITKGMVGLGNVDNTSDANKPVSTATQSALDLKANLSSVDASFNLKADLASPTFTGTVGGITKGMVGLGNADNTSDANKPVSTATQSALDLKANLSSVDASFNLKADLANPTFTGTVGGITKSMVGLGNADNTSDANKPISTATQSALDLKANLSSVDASLNLKANIDSPALTGTPSAPTAAASTNSTQIATTEFVKTAVANLVASAPATLDTLNELALALGSDASFSTTVSNAIGLKAPIDNPTFTGTVGGITKGMVGLGNADNTTDANKPISTATQSALDLKASISNVDASLNLKADLASPTFTGTVGGITKGMVGLGNADNTTDANKPISTATQSALDLKANLSSVDASLNLKADLASPTFTGTVGGITKSMVGLGNADNTTDANKPISTATQSALDLKANISNVDASFSTYKTTVDNSFSSVDTIKANKASPTFTGTVTAPKLTSGDASFNGNVDISGVLSVRQTVNSVVTNTTINNYNVAVTNDLSLNGKLLVSSDVSLNSKLYVNGDASFSGRVDICGNFYAKYPVESIPSSAIIGGVSNINLNNDLSVNGLTIGCGTNDISTNSVVGYQALLSNTTGRENSAFGFHALRDNSGGSQNSAYGYQALRYNTSGIENTAFGDNAGFNNKTGTYNTFLGANTDVDSSGNTWTSSSAIGANAKITASNQIVLGTSMEMINVPGKLSIVGDVSFSGNITISDSSGIDVLLKTVTSGNYYPRVKALQLGPDIDSEANYDGSGYSVSMNSDGTIVAIGAIYSPNGTMFGLVRVFKYQTITDLNWNNYTVNNFTYDGGATYNKPVVVNGGDANPVANKKYWVLMGGDINGEFSGDGSGWSVSLSSDGATVAVGAPRNDGTTGTAGDERGHVRVYKYDVTKTTNVTDQSSNDFGPVGWRRLGKDIDAESAGSQSGYSVSMNSDGTIVAIGAFSNRNPSAVQTGQVRVYKYQTIADATWTNYNATDFSYTGISPYNKPIVVAGGDANPVSGKFYWVQMGADIDGESAGDYNGFTVSINGDGTIIATGGHLNDGIALNAGHVRVYKYQTIADATWTNYNATSFSYTGTSPNNKPIVVAGGDANPVSGKFYWVQMGVDIEGESVGEWGGYSVSLSADGQIVAFGAPRNDGITNNTSNANTIAGQVRVYKYDVNKITSVTDQSSNDFGPIGWRRLGKDINGGEANNDHFGWSVSLSSDGTIVAIGAYLNDGNGSNSGSVRIYKYNNLVWNQICGDIDGEVAGDNAGFAVAISGDGRTVAIGANLNDGAGPDRGHVRVYQIQAIGNKLSINRQAEINGLTIGSANADIITNSAIGYQSLNAVTTGNQNSAYGYQALLLNTTGNNNTAFGYQAGDLNTTGSNNTFLGSLADTTNTWSNSTAIGYNARITASNQIKLGTATEIVNVPGKLSIIGDASYNGRVDICGNFYAQYPAVSIPSSAIIGGATQSYVDTSLNLKANLTSPTFTGTVGGITQSMVGLGNVDNTSDANKPISTATQNALDLKADLTSPSFTGTPTAPTASYDNSSNQLATTGFVQSRISSIINSAPAALDTLNELAAALGNNANYAATITTSLSLKAPLENPTFTGTVNGITQSMVGLANVDNTTDANKPISTATQSALDLKATISAVDASLNLKANLASPTFTGTVGGITQSMVGLANVDNTTDANKPISTATQSALDLKASITNVDASLNLKANLASPIFTGTVGGITQSMVGLGNVDNTSDANKPISTATQNALDLKAALASPTFTGTPTAPTASYDNSSNQLATTGFVQSRISSIINSAPAALDTLNELAAALGNDANYAATINNSLSLRAPLENPTFTGTVNGITKSMVGLANVDNTADANKPISTATQNALDLKASIGNVDASLNLKANLASPTFTGTVGGITKSMVGLANVDNTSDANKPISTATQSALDLKASIGNVDASLNLKASIGNVDASLNLKANLANPTFTGTVGGITQSMVGLANVDNTSDANKPISTATQSALDLKASISVVDTSLNLKANLANPTFTGTVGGITKSMVDLANVDNTSDANKPISTATQSALNLKASISGVDTSLNLKPSFSQVDVSLNLKANYESPAFTGTIFASKASIGDTSFNGNVDISGILSVTQRVNSVVKNTTINNYAVSVTNDLSLNGILLVSADVSFNSKLYVNSDASFNGRVDICGNFYAQYPANSIPSSAIIGGGGSSIDSAQLDASLNLKPSFAQVDASLNLKPSFAQVDASLNLKPSVSQVDASLNLKANLASPTFTGIVTLPTITSGDASFNGNVDISGVLSVRQTANSVVTNTTINNYNVAVTNDLSLNGKLLVSSDVSLNSKLYVNGDASFNGNVGISGEYLRFANSHLRNNATNSRLEYNVNTGYSHSLRINNVEKLAIKDDGNGSTLQLPSCQIREYTPFSWLYYNIPSGWTHKFAFNTNMALEITDSADGIRVAEAVSMLNNKKIIWNEGFVSEASIRKNTTTSAFEYGVATGYKHSWLVNNVEGMSLGSKLIVVSDASFNSKLSVGNDASFNGRVDICGNFYAQYPASSIPSSAIIGGVGGGGGGSSIDYAQLDASLNLKANLASPTFTGIVTLPTVTSGDASFNGNVDISGVLSVKQTVNSVVTNTTINNYNVAVTNDISLNGNLRASGQITAASFNATSDYRIKSNILPLSDCSFGIDALTPVTYHNKITDREDIGFIAHELQPHFPFLVTGEKDGDAIQTVNYNGIIGLLVHELQQLKKNVMPQTDLIYRGSVQLTNGLAYVNLDNRFNVPDGTFAAFRDVAVFTTNEGGWDQVRGSISGNILTIECMSNTSNAQVSYLIAAKPK